MKTFEGQNKIHTVDDSFVIKMQEIVLRISEFSINPIKLLLPVFVILWTGSRVIAVIDMSLRDRFLFSSGNSSINVDPSLNALNIWSAKMIIDFIASFISFSITSISFGVSYTNWTHANIGRAFYSPYGTGSDITYQCTSADIGSYIKCSNDNALYFDSTCVNPCDLYTLCQTESFYNYKIYVCAKRFYPVFVLMVIKQALNSIARALLALSNEPKNKLNVRILDSFFSLIFDIVILTLYINYGVNQSGLTNTSIAFNVISSIVKCYVACTSKP